MLCYMYCYVWNLEKTIQESECISNNTANVIVGQFHSINLYKTLFTLNSTLIMIHILHMCGSPPGVNDGLHTELHC